MKILDELDSIPMDFIMSVGPACRPAQQIKQAGLRVTSSPLDWMQLYPLTAVTHCFSTGFTDFFEEIEDISPDENRKNRRVVDVNNDICSIHHFPMNEPLEKAQKRVRRMMRKRFKRIDRLMCKAKAICLVANRDEPTQVLLEFLEEFEEIYPDAYLYMVNIRHTSEPGFQVSVVSGRRCTLYEAHFCDEHPDGTDITKNPDAWQGNTPYWMNTLRHLCLSDRTIRWANSPLQNFLHKI